VSGYNKEDQFFILLLVLQDYGIVKKLKAIITNNAFLNNVLCRTIKAYYKDKLSKEWLANN
jgi:hypothetical protein